MADYNIYIRTIGGTSPNEASNPFIPWGDKETADVQTQPWANQGGSSFNVGGAIGMGMGLKRIANKAATSGLGMVATSVAVATTVLHITDKVLSTAFEFDAIINGNFSNQIALQNMKANFESLMNPVGTLINRFRFNMERTVENQRRQLNRELLGDSVINTYTNLGV